MFFDSEDSSTLEVGKMFNGMSCLTLFISPGPPEPKKKKKETLNYPPKSLANLNRRSRDLLSTQQHKYDTVFATINNY